MTKAATPLGTQNDDPSAVEAGLVAAAMATRAAALLFGHVVLPLTSFARPLALALFLHGHAAGLQEKG